MQTQQFFNRLDIEGLEGYCSTMFSRTDKHVDPRHKAGNKLGWLLGAFTHHEATSHELRRKFLQYWYFHEVLRPR
jgi:hypothetical protein